MWRFIIFRQARLLSLIVSVLPFVYLTLCPGEKPYKVLGSWTPLSA